MYDFIYLFALLHWLRLHCNCGYEGESKNNLALFLILKEKAPVYSPLTTMLFVGFFGCVVLCSVLYMPFGRLRKFPSISNLLRVFITYGCHILSNTFCFAFIVIIIGFFVLCFF